MISATALVLVRHNLNAAKARLLEDDFDHALATVIDAIAMLVDDQSASAPALPASEATANWLPGAVIWRCTGCPKVLGYVVPATDSTPARIMVRHFKRKTTFSTVDEVEQSCDGCGAVNHWPRRP